MKPEIDAYRTKEWRNNKGELHRTDGPAIIYANGTKEWYLNGKLHREDGPAVERTDGSKFWYLNGKIHREDGPAFEHNNGDKSWWVNGKRNREDGPAIEHNNGDKSWWVNGERHREDGPAFENKNGDKFWYLKGEELSESEFNAKTISYINNITIKDDGSINSLTKNNTNGKTIKVPKIVAKIIRGERPRGKATTGRISRTTTGSGHNCYKARAVKC